MSATGRSPVRLDQDAYQTPGYCVDKLLPWLDLNGRDGEPLTFFEPCRSPEDIWDIEAGGLHHKTLGSYAQSFAEGIRSRCSLAKQLRDGIVWGLEVKSTIALLKGKRVVRQGTFTGAHEVKT